MRTIIDKITIKFMIAGVVNTIVGAGIMFLSYNTFNLNYWVSSALNYLTGGIVSYFMSKYFTFRSNKKGIAQVLKFAVNTGCCYVIAYGMAKPLIWIVLGRVNSKVKDNIAMTAGMCLFTGVNYVGQRYIVFREKKE